MCGIAGFFNQPKDEKKLDQMLAMIEHRGPDEFGTYMDSKVGMGTARLSIVDIAHGQQPIMDEKSGCVIVFNGEVFNYIELKKDLETKGYSFKTSSDTEVILKLYLEHGMEFPKFLNGQFAISIWDPRVKKMILARDRFGICPLFYHQRGKGVFFASEMKCLLVNEEIPRKLNAKALDQIFTFWTTIPGHTSLVDIFEVIPGHIMTITDGGVESKPYWSWPFPSLQKKSTIDFETAKKKFVEELSRAVMIRLRADIEVGSYLSGGIDSSAIVALASKIQGDHLTTYSVGFSDETYDETKYQKMVSERAKTNHSHLVADYVDVDRFFEKVIWHAETPIFRTAPSPMYYLSSTVHAHGKKVVLTGEGSDEILLGYDIFREVKVRRFWRKNPESKFRSSLFKKLYAYLPQFSNPRYATLAIQSFQGTLTSDSPFYSHLIRWNNNAANKVYFSKALKESLGKYDAIGELEKYVPKEYFQVNDVDKAQYLELITLLRGYLLCSQGDRMMMANSVEGRFPFLDHELVNFANQLPEKYKLRGLQDKLILRESMKPYLPEEICYRPKFAYQAPELRAFCRPDKSKSDLVTKYMSPEYVTKVGLFEPEMVDALLKKIDVSELSRLGTRDNMAFVQILSTHLFYHHFIEKDFTQLAEKRILNLPFKTRIRA